MTNPYQKDLHMQAGNAVVITILVIAAIIVGVFLFMREDEVAEVSPSPSVSATISVSPTTSPAATASPTKTAAPTVTPGVSIKNFNVVGSAFTFNLKEIRVKRGDTVKINFTNSGGQHDWVIDEFNARTPVLNAGQSATVQFVANKSGTFEYYCSVGNHRAMGMEGKLIVE